MTPCRRLSWPVSDANLLARLAAGGHPVSLRVELRTRYLEDDRSSYNVIAEIPGRDAALRDEIVLVGAHLDSWHTASGATDNADGAVAVMEAMRILSALGAQPRRTIRAALWSGEEQGLLGASAYIAQHFNNQSEKDRLAVYLNDDPGAGKTLGFYMEGNREAKAIFDRWLEPLQGLGATRNILDGIGATDHVPFNQAGLPGFNVIKDFHSYRRAHTSYQRGLPGAHERGRTEGVRHLHGDVRVAGGDGRPEDPEAAG